jgi:hypothetical protein
MKKLIFALVVGLTLTSCYKDPQSVTQEGKGFEVEFLFEKDGVKVYRFYDGSRRHYFTTRGETITSQKSGKTTYQETIN